jgi:ribosome-associated protein
MFKICCLLVSLQKKLFMAKKRIVEDIDGLLKAIHDSLAEKKAEDILVLNLKKTGSSVCDYFVICTGNSDVHVNTLAQFTELHVKTQVKEKPWKREGLENNEWVLLDYVNVVVHIFQPKSRDFYRLEQLWADAEPVLIKN